MVVRVVTGDPDIPLPVDMDAMLALGPVVALPGTAPALEQLAVGRELQHRRRSLAAAGLGRGFLRSPLVLDQGIRPMHDPNIILLVNGDPNASSTTTIEATYMST